MAWARSNLMRRRCVTALTVSSTYRSPPFVSVHDAFRSVASRTFHAPRRFHPGYSWLGRWLRRRTDRQQGEALHILIVTGLALGLVLVHYLSWTLFYELFETTPLAQRIYWTSQLVLLGATAALCLVGARPALVVTARSDALSIEQGGRTLTVPYEAITSVQSIPARRFHQHERRYAATRVFIGAMHENVLLLRRIEGGPVVIGLPPSSHEALHAHLNTVQAAPSRQTPAPA